MDFHKFKFMDLVEEVHIFGLTNIHTFGPNVSLIRLFRIMQNPEYQNSICQDDCVHYISLK